MPSLSGLAINRRFAASNGLTTICSSHPAVMIINSWSGRLTPRADLTLSGSLAPTRPQSKPWLGLLTRKAFSSPVEALRTGVFASGTQSTGLKPKASKPIRKYVT